MRGPFVTAMHNTQTESVARADTETFSAGVSVISGFLSIQDRTARRLLKCVSETCPLCCSFCVYLWSAPVVQPVVGVC